MIRAIANRVDNTLTPINRYTRNTKNTLFVVLLAGFGGSTGGCNAEPAAPDCPDGPQASATLVMMGDLDDIRPIERTKDIHVRGSRESTDPCITEGALSTFSFRLQGDGGDMKTMGGLAPGAWTITITPLSGGDQSVLREAIVLPAGGRVELEVGASPAGQMVPGPIASIDGAERHVAPAND